MTKRKRNEDGLLDQAIEGTRRSRATSAIVNAAGARVLSHLRTQRFPNIVSPAAFRKSPVRHWKKGVAAAALLLAIGATFLFFRSQPKPSIASTVDGVVFRVFGGNAHPIGADEPIANGETIRAGIAGSLLGLADGSRIEMESGTELALTHDSDGVRIRLGIGNVIVTAVKQKSSHLFVQTRDCTVSVVGTVFSVNASTAGSRVAVFEGEVRVEHNGKVEPVRAGEQLVTNPEIQPLSLDKGIAWSRNAMRHLALLPQAPPPAAPAVTPQATEPVPVSDAPGHIEGAVLDAGSNRPLSDVLVRLTPSSVPPPPDGLTRAAVALGPGNMTASTNTEGRFVFDGVKPGAWMLTVLKAGFVAARSETRRLPGSPITTLRVNGGQQLQGLVVRMTTVPVVTGKVIDSRGEPLRAITVTPYRTSYDVNGIATRRYFQTATTDDRGEYRFNVIEPGEYFFTMEPRSLGLAEAVPTTFYTTYYPGTTDASKARTMLIDEGRETRLSDVVLASGRGGTLAVRVLNESGVKPRNAITVRAVRKPEGLTMRTGLVVPGTEMVRIGPLPPGFYSVEATFGDSIGPQIRAATSVEIAENAMNEIPLDLIVPQMGQLTDRVQIASRGRPPQPVNGVLMAIVDAAGTGDPQRRYSRNTDAEGIAVHGGMLPGTYTIGSNTKAPAGFYLASAMEGTRDVLKDGIVIKSGQEAAIDVLFDGPAPRVRGAVTDSAGNRVPSALVALVPDNRSLRPYFVSTATSQGGEFEIEGAAGAFHIYAWREVESAAFRNADFMKPYDSLGTPLRLEKDGSAHVNIKVLERP